MSLDITDTLAPKSDQINADDVAGRSVVVTVAGVEKIAGEQPLTRSPARVPRSPLEAGEDGSPYPRRRMGHRRRTVDWATGGNLHGRRGHVRQGQGRRHPHLTHVTP